MFLLEFLLLLVDQHLARCRLQIELATSLKEWLSVGVIRDDFLRIQLVCHGDSWCLRLLLLLVQFDTYLDVSLLDHG